MKNFLILIVIASVLMACAVQKQRGVKASKTSSYFGTFTKVDTCNPVLQWEVVNIAEYQAELDKSLKYLEEEEKKAAMTASVSSVAVTSSYPKTITYDLIVYEAIKPPRPDTPWGTGRKAFYQEGIQGTSLQIAPPLNPKSKYFWSVRVRLPDNRVYAWSTYNKSTFYPGGWAEKNNYLFGIKTPRSCER